MEIISSLIIIISVVFMLFGIIGIFKTDDFYANILVSSKIDTVGVTTLIIGLVLKHGFGFFSLKLILLLCIMIAIGPLSAHIIARSAYLSGYGNKENKDG